MTWLAALSALAAIVAAIIGFRGGKKTAERDSRLAALEAERVSRELAARAEKDLREIEASARMRARERIEALRAERERVLAGTQTVDLDALDARLAEIDRALAEHDARIEGEE